MLSVGGVLLAILWLICARAAPRITHATEPEDADSDDEDGSPQRIVGSSLAKLTSKWGKDAERGEAGGAKLSAYKPKVGYRTKGKPIKVFVEIGGEVHILRVAMAPIESVEDLHQALGQACEEANAPELRDLDFKLDAQLQLQFLAEDDVARAVEDDTPIGLLKCAKAMRAWRSP